MWKVLTASFVMNWLNRELFDTLKEAQVLIEDWRQEYNTIRPHSALGYRPPAPESVLLPFASDETFKGSRRQVACLELSLKVGSL